jgi:hypothetical protein
MGIPSNDLLKDVQYITNFDAPDAHFDYSSLFSDVQVEKVQIRKKVKTVEEQSDENQT